MKNIIRKWLVLFIVFTLMITSSLFTSAVQASSTQYEQQSDIVLTEPAGKVPGNSNPLITHKYGADPYALVYDGRVYIYD